ncbi:MAG: hypothetical protein J6P60_05230 [Lachnospiraceae bacterium]|nr:hypothetical protein [Lachnospiraceae bacterium]
MWKDIFRIIKKLAVLLVPIYVLLPLYCAFFPMYYMDDEYAMYRQQREYCLQETEDDKEIIILGDSRTKAGLVPEVLSENSYNLALGGATPIEGYYSLREYLQHHDAPKTIILAYAPMHYMDVDTLWTRTVYFHNMDRDDFFEILQNAKNCQKKEKILLPHYGLEYAMYALYLPNKYATALKKSGFVFRHRQTVTKYREMKEQRGHTLYGTENGSGGVNGEAHESDFEASDVIDLYLDRMLDLCREEGISVILEQLPMNETSYSILQPDFKTHYKEYMAGIADAHPEALVNAGFCCYNNEYFGDADHLNAEGCEVYTQFIREKYGFR